MLALGVGVSMASRPVVSCVLLGGSRSSPTLLESFDLRPASDNIEEQIVELGRQLSSKIVTIEPTTVVIRIADFQPVSSRAAGPRHRLLIEGALTMASKLRLPDVRLRTGKEVGKALDLRKEDADSWAATMDRRRTTAAAAALSGLPE